MKLQQILIASAVIAGLSSASAFAAIDDNTAMGSSATTSTAPSTTATTGKTVRPAIHKAKAHKVKMSAKKPAKHVTHKVVHHAKKPVHRSTNL